MSNKMSDEEADKAMQNSFDNGQKLAKELVAMTRGHGAEIVGTIGIVLAYFETQHSGTIDDVVRIARTVSALHDANKKLDELAANTKPN